MPGNPAGSGARFDRWASTYDASPLQPALFAPVHQTTLQLAQQLLPDARRILDVGCGTGRLLRQPRQRYWRAELVGVDLARGMVAAAIAATPTELGVRYIRAGAEHLPFTEGVFDLVVATMSMRHWTDRAAGIAETGRVLTPGGVCVLADVFPSSPRPTLMGSMLLRRRRPSLPTVSSAVGPWSCSRTNFLATVSRCGSRCRASRGRGQNSGSWPMACPNGTKPSASGAVAHGRSPIWRRRGSLGRGGRRSKPVDDACSSRVGGRPRPGDRSGWAGRPHSVARAGDHVAL